MKLKKKYLNYGFFVFIILVVLFFYLKNVNKPYYPDIYTPRPVLGNESARITITEFSDLQCPACKAAHPTVNRIMEEFKNDVKLEYMHFPLPMHQYAFKAAEAAECANDQGKFWEFVDKVHASSDDPTPRKLKNYAKELSLDMKNFSNCLDSSAKASYVARDVREAKNMGVDATPTFFINGEKLSNWRYDIFKQKIMEEIAKK
ncbi:MAG: thioredoxin domain-containing protein [Candidatus Woesearchaeota archaeon]|nr:thioredoxin domain-containing protein [Candidatus Woesearchaeota archaeon]